MIYVSEEMRPIGDFVRARALKMFSSIESFIVATRLSKQTVYNVFDKDTPESVEAAQPGTREAIAEASGFIEWADLVDAWTSNDLLRGLKNERSSQSAEEAKLLQVVLKKEPKLREIATERGIATWKLAEQLFNDLIESERKRIEEIKRKQA